MQKRQDGSYDVFRPHLHLTPLTAYLGSGIQIFPMILIIIGSYIGQITWGIEIIYQTV